MNDVLKYSSGVKIRPSSSEQVPWLNVETAVALLLLNMAFVI